MNITKVKILTEEQAVALHGKELCGKCHLFNVVEDNSGNKILTRGQVEMCTNPEFWWLSSLPEIDFEPKIYEEIE